MNMEDTSNKLIHTNYEEPFSDEQVWGSRERTISHYVIEKDEGDDGSWSLLWVVYSKFGDTPDELANQKFTSPEEATKVIQSYIRKQKDTNNV
jgi:hypothetical protein